MIKLLIKLGVKPKRLWRPLTGVVVAYAVAAQTLLIALGGFSLPAQAHDSAPGFELCVHDNQAVPDQPDGGPAYSGCTHCIFCFAGSHHAVVGAPPGVFHRVHVEIIEAPWAADRRALPLLPAHSIANPRGPPLRA
jgi:hypothetical protein